MSGTDQAAAAVNQQEQSMHAPRKCAEVIRACSGFGKTLQQFCPTQAEVQQGVDRVRESIRQQPVLAIAIAAGAGLVAGMLTHTRHHGMSARR